MGLPLAVTVTLTEINCGECGGTYAINERYRQQKYEKGQSWNCPYCRTGWGYTKGENTRLKEEAARERQRTQEALARANAAEAARRNAEAARDRLKQRAAAGVCPCCNRTFRQLSAHMKSKHPDFSGKSPAPRTPLPKNEFAKAKAKHDAKVARKHGYESG